MAICKVLTTLTRGGGACGMYIVTNAHSDVLRRVAVVDAGAAGDGGAAARLEYARCVSPCCQSVCHLSTHSFLN